MQLAPALFRNFHQGQNGSQKGVVFLLGGGGPNPSGRQIFFET